MFTLVTDCESEPTFIVANLQSERVKTLCDRMTEAVHDWWNQTPEPPNADGQVGFVAARLGILLSSSLREPDLEDVFTALIKREGGTVVTFALAQVEI